MQDVSIYRTCQYAGCDDHHCASTCSMFQYTCRANIQDAPACMDFQPAARANPHDVPIRRIVHQAESAKLAGFANLQESQFCMLCKSAVSANTQDLYTRTSCKFARRDNVHELHICRMCNLSSGRVNVQQVPTCRSRTHA